MIRRLAPLLAVPFLLVLAGCGTVGDAAKDIAGKAASQAGTGAIAELQAQICATVEDGQLSERDRDVLAGLVSAADAAGVPAEFLTPIDSITGGSEQVSGNSLDALLEACGSATTPAPANG